MATLFYNAGENGILRGNPTVAKPIGSSVLSSDIPRVEPRKGFTFRGWDVNPAGMIVRGNTTFNAVYEEHVPWYRRFWLWLTGLFTGKGCLKWLLWLLLAFLLTWLLSWLLGSCQSCSRQGTGVVESGRVAAPDGNLIDDNGVSRPIGVHDGRLPDDAATVPPVRDEDGTVPPIDREDGLPPVVANRLFLFLEDDNGDVDALAQDFKRAYPEDKYSIIGFDRDVKSMVIRIPENERDEIRETINSRLPNHKFIVFDEEVYELNGHESSTSLSTPGWHLKAVHARQGWDITKGSPSVVVAVLDDGIDASHPIFKGRIEGAYNVFTKDNHLSQGIGHGTHTAALAAGSLDYLDRGVAGIAPECMLMPVQVIDNNMCPLSALVSGVMYAIHKGADVVNISIGPSFKGLNMLPVEMQKEIGRTQFKNQEKLWNRVCRVAADKNTVLVFAAGNDDILSSIPPENRTSVALSVGAVDQKLYPTDFTNYGTCTDISAPGSEIYSAFPGNDFKSFDGTSMAAPIVSGTVALMKSLKKDLTVEQAYNVLYATGGDVFGNMPPIVLVDAALDAVKRGDFIKPAERVMPYVPGSGGDNPASWGQVAPDNPSPLPVVDDNAEYESIRRMIEIYKQKISELEGKLPENSK